MPVGRFIAVLFLSNALYAQSGEELPFQVLVAEGATVYGEAVQPLQFINDVTSIELESDGFLCLVHKGGTTFEINEKVFTFYLKPEPLKNRSERPDLSLLYQDSAVLDQTKLITVLHPPFDRSGYLVWNQNDPLKIYWHLHDEPVLNYIVSVSDGKGNKIQDFRTKLNEYELAPTTYGLAEPNFSFKLKSTFAGETIESKNYFVALKDETSSTVKASDQVLKARDLELNPTLALEAWQEVMTMPNARFYRSLFVKFLNRNSSTLTAAGVDVQQLLSQNK
ncbi:MAG: hypothetical protein Tsb0034_13960 [Ekhidna sp.]